MTRINDEFMEAFKHLDKICKEMFNAEKGVTSYIDEMERISSGPRYVPNWNFVLRRLKDLRHIRNTHSHEIGTSYGDICSPEDVQWLESFYSEIMNTTDPIAQYRKATAPKPKSKMPTSTQYNPNDFHTFTPQYEQEEEETISGLAIFIICLVVVAVVVGVFFAVFV